MNGFVLSVVLVFATISSNVLGEYVFMEASSTSDGFEYRVNINQNYLENQTILTAECTDKLNPTANVTYSLLSGQFFKIDQTTGVVSLVVDGMSFSPQLYSDTVVCKAFRTVVATATLKVTFSIQNEHIPVFSHPTQFEFAFSENYDISSDIVDLNATDDDRGVCGEINYSIASRHPEGLFQIDSSAGILSFARSLDYDTELEHRYTVLVSAGSRNRQQCSSPASRTAQAIVTIEVTDINDTPPKFDSHVYNVSIRENLRPHAVQDVHCSDPDTTSFIIYSITDSHRFPFEITNTGEINVTSELDYEEHPSYLINVSCTDIGSNEMQRGYALINITVLPVNEHRPEIMLHSSVITFEDNTLKGTILFSPVPGSGAIVTYSVADGDRGSNHSRLNFSLISVDEPYYNSYFALNRTTGELFLQRRFQKTCKQEGSIGLLSIQLVISVCDTPNTLTCPRISIQVYVIPTNCIVMFSTNHGMVFVNETTPIGTKLESIPCRDGSKNSNKTVTILSDHDPEISEIFSLSQQDNSLVLLQPLDYERRDNYTFHLFCVNSYQSETTAVLEVVVVPENDNPPYFEKSVYIINITTPILAIPQQIGQVEAGDPDKDAGSNLAYSLINPSQLFAVESNGSVLVTDSLPNSEGAFVLEVRASDGEFSANTTILVLLQYVLRAQVDTSKSEDSSTALIIVLAAIATFVVVLLLLSWVLICILHFRRKLKLQQTVHNDRVTASPARDYNQCDDTGTVECLAYNMTALTSQDPAFNSCQYSEIKGPMQNEDPDYETLRCNQQISLTKSACYQRPQPYAVPRHNGLEPMNSVENYVTMQGATSPTSQTAETAVSVSETAPVEENEKTQQSGEGDTPDGVGGKHESSLDFGEPVETSLDFGATEGISLDFGAAVGVRSRGTTPNRSNRNSDAGRDRVEGEGGHELECQDAQNKEGGLAASNSSPDFDPNRVAPVENIYEHIH